MSNDARVRDYWREEFFLIGVLFFFFSAIVALSFNAPFDARLFPIVIGTAGMLLTVVIGVEQVRRRLTDDTPVLDQDDPAARSGWLRLTTALLSAPVFGLLFWLFGFVAASLVAMLLMPPLMGYRDRKQHMVVAGVTVAILAFIAPYLLNIDVPHGLLGNWLIDKLALRPS
jgi:hypothetical protein